MPGNTSELARLIEEKSTIVQELLVLVQQQEAIIGGERMAELMPLLSKKQAVIDRLVAVQQTLQPFAAEDPQQRLWDSPSVQERCRQAEQQTDTLLCEIMQRDANCERLLSESRDALGSRLQQTTGSQQAAQAYRAAQASGGSRGSRLDLTAG